MGDGVQPLVRATAVAAPLRTVTDSLLVVSNGHGEDVIGALLAVEIVRQGGARRVAALPLVGDGRSYERCGVEVLGPRTRLPSDGFTLHDPRLAWRDLRAGLVRMTLRQAASLRRTRVDGVLVVGDVYAQAMATLVRARRAVVQPLVSVRLADGGGSVPWNRTFMERIRAPERTLMRRAERVYARDEATASWLRSRGVARAVFLGNPMMDGLAGRRLPTPPGVPVVALLPGTRGHAPDSARRMLEALASIGPVHALVAWTHGPPPRTMEGWRPGPARVDGVEASWTCGNATAWWVRGRFADVLASADAVLGTSGTAQEQAAGLGLPVVAFAVPPIYSAAFLTNQRRLLGDALRVVPNDAAAIAAALRDALRPGPHRDAARRVGPARMGPAGGTARIVADVLQTFAGAAVTAARG